MLKFNFKDIKIQPRNSNSHQKISYAKKTRKKLQDNIHEYYAWFRGTYTKIETEKRLAWPPCKDDMQIPETLQNVWREESCG